MNEYEHTVLLVDDDAKLLNGLQRSLSGERYQILTAVSAAEAAAMLKSFPVDVIVSDEQMPGMSGTELLTQVRRDYPDVIRMILTGNATVPVLLRAIKDGSVHQFLTKPCDAIELASAIRSALEQKDGPEMSQPIDEAKLLGRLKRATQTEHRSS